MAKGNKLIDDHVQISVNLVKYKSHGHSFEIAIDPDKAVAYKEGENLELEEIVQSNKVFEDMKKGLAASDANLQEVFKTINTTTIFKFLLENGEIQFTQKYRADLRERKFRKIINLIHINAINPKNGSPHPLTRIEAAMSEAKVKIDNLKKAEDQIDSIVKLLRPIIPISIQTTTLQINIPTQHSAKLRGRVMSYGKITDEQWLNDGSVLFTIKIPAGLQNKLMDELNNSSQGSCTIDIIEKSNRN